MRMSNYSVKILSKQMLANNTLGIRIEKPAGFTFQPGQYVTLTIPNTTDIDPNGNGRYFSIANSPDEPNLLFGIRLLDTAYKKRLISLDVGETVEINDAAGSFLIDQSSNRPLVFFAGGIGVTPIRSMVNHLIKNNISREITAFYSNRTPEDAAFMDDFASWQREHESFKIIHTMSRVSEEHSWAGNRGRFTTELVSSHMARLKKPICYIVGTHEFISGIRTILNNIGIPEQDVIREVYCGYCPDHSCCCDYVH